MNLFKRDIEKALQDWAESADRKPLVLRGARQVGKTSVVNKFGLKFDNYLYVNLYDDNICRVIDEAISVERLVPTLFANAGKGLKKGKTLLFFDEIQNSSKAVLWLRFFYEQMPDIYVIAAGSLLETMIDRQISFPVGRVEYLAMHPVSFREFLSAKGDDAIRQALHNDVTLCNAFHSKLSEAFKTFSLIGGMPAVVAHYIEHQDLIALNKYFDTLLNGYADDVEKYAANRTQVEVIRLILKVGWAQAGKQISFVNFGNSNYRSREIGEALRTLEKAMLLELVYPLTQTAMPALPNMRRQPKLLWLDAGLASAAVNNKKDIFSSPNLFDIWKGAYAEQLVGQELFTLSESVRARRLFWVNESTQSSAEVDFVWEYDGRLIPVEVKLGHNNHLKSLHQYMELSKDDVAVRVWNASVQVDEVETLWKKKKFKLINIPFYMVGFLPQIIQTV
ncbi:MAG: ATP-binding protein [Paludibacteraceae bacterium]|nr:ATP-binding protein [Paludibacteraceae bacterium]